MGISKEKEALLKKRMEDLHLFEEDIVEKFIQGSGKGGQKINKTSSCVYLKHLPSQIEIKCQKSRSRELNRYYARYALCEKILQKEHREKSEKKKLQEKIRRQKRRRSRRGQLKILADKKKRGEIKAKRSPPDIL